MTADQSTAPRSETPMPEQTTPLISDEDAQLGCNGEPHIYSSEHGANCPIWVGRCMVCGVIDWQDLIEQAASIAERARQEERARAVTSPGQVEPEPADVWKVSDGTVPIGGVSPKSVVIHSDWNGGHPVEIVEIEDGRRAYGVTFAAWRDVRKPEGRSTVVRVPSDTQVAPCTLNGTPTP